ncbi:hypothetical protein PYW08_010867 [Mythimna loreyi]|uniref:Uncharacterized protein n=1 Tax=Mythimna loreyi TaxID=667449 RepID=A0ACC2Q1M1_9NEOP|nr:hypothetical protein PYW08_010867 [Mythimna loreyi]
MVSETSSELPSEQGSVPKPTPSDVASEIARRLGAREPAKIVEREAEDEEPPKPTVRKIYRPQDPVSSTIFPDEPPPLSEQSDSESDIFADLHRTQPYARAQPYARTGAADDLFGADHESDEGDIFSDFANKPTTNPSANPASLFDSGPAPNMFVKHTDHPKHLPDDNHRRQVYESGDDGRKVYEERGIGDDLRGRGDEPERGVKKPIGGISLFGNKGTESIGAAILNRNQRKSSTSDDESESDSRSESQSNQKIKTEKDIFDDLFARSENKKVTKEKDISKDFKTEIKKKVEVKEKKIEKPKVDLFSDNLFDDIDDIFSTNVVRMPAKDTAKTKSIFEDDDDLFSEIAAPKPVKIEVASSSNKKSLFDSDDELFSENKPVDKPKEKPKPVTIEKPKAAERKINETSNISKEITKSIFDDDEDELFGDSKTVEVSKVQTNTVSIENRNNFGKENKNIAPKNTFKSPSLFDDDDEESDIFAEPVKTPNVQNVITGPIRETKLSNETDESIHTKLSSNVDEILPKAPSSQTEVKIPEENVERSSLVKSVKSEEVIVKNVEINKDSSKPTVDEITNITEIEKTLDNEDSVLPLSKNVVSENKYVETNASRIFDHLRHTEPSSTDTNDDFSDQDFDDLPPKEESTKPVIDNSNIDTEKHNIFDKVTLEEDIDELFAATQQKSDNSESIFNTKPDFTESITKKTEQDNKKEEITPKDIERDIFSNILTEPPAFEKPKEPKKSKNVNALFDDDSDDESLFFKKNDTIFVENPQEFTPTQDRIFGLFSDEPPDDGFSKISDEFDDDMFSTLPKPKIPQDAYPPIPDTLPFEDTIPEIEKPDTVREISTDLPQEEIKVTKESSLDKEEDIFKVTTTETVAEGQKSSVLFNDEQLFKVPTKESKPPKENPILDSPSDEENLFGTAAGKPSSSKEITPPENVTPVKPALKEKPTLDTLSDDENLFASERKSETTNTFETVKEQPKDKKLISKDKINIDMLIKNENLFTTEPKVEKTKPNIETVQDKPNIDTLSVEENLFSSKPKPDIPKPALKDKPSLDLISDDENLFGSVAKVEKSPSLTSSVLHKPVPAAKKPILQDKPAADSFSDDDNLFASTSKVEKSTISTQDKPVSENKRLESVSKSSDDELFSSLEKTEKPLITESKLLQQDSKSDEDLFKIPAKSEFLSKPSEIKAEKSEKKVGKLKVGLNINVNALLPGASPKKIKPNDQPDGQSQSVAESPKPELKTHTELPKSETETPSPNTDSKLQKAVSFEGKPESDVLDNKISKERAKIQVKRRPSTRRARREAVRKSGIDFGEDSTDNSSSIDDPPRKQTDIKKENPKPNENISNILPDRSDVQAKLDDTTVQAKIDTIPVEKQPTIEPEKPSEVTEKPSYSRNVKSKVVYILNDEDIFNTSPVENINKNISKNLDSNVGVSTLGKVYDKDAESKSKTDAKSSLFGEETDDEMFKPKTVVKKSTIFDSDSEEDLFGTTSKEEERKVEKVEVKREIKREVVKGSLFGDDDEDDDLFGVKTKKTVEQKPQPSRPTIKETPKTAEPVFEDPLSMFGDDD